MKEIDDFDWNDMVRWHEQHLRIQEEQLQIAQISSQMSVASALGGGSSPEEEYQDIEDVMDDNLGA